MTPRVHHLLAISAAMALLVALSASGPAGAREDQGSRSIRNPYFEKAEWRVWRDNEEPIEGIQSIIREEKEEKPAIVTLAPIERVKRIYPVDVKPGGPADRYMEFAAASAASERYAGFWDDVYTSWSNLHGYVRNRWKDAAGNTATVLPGIIHFADNTPNRSQTVPTGVNFVHQSTTGMGHAIANGYSPGRTELFEKIYFADVLVTGPSHASFTDARIERTDDLYMALFPTIFNSVGSSNSETMAITKMIIAGAYLPPETKLILKRNGLYPAAMLYLWKASLPYSVTYDHELRHRIAYKAVGDRARYPESYGAAGIERGDLCLPYHCYDDPTHMRNMVEMAKGMDVPPPEAILRVLEVDGGRVVYSLKKSLLVVQEQGQRIVIRVSTADCYDLLDRPLEMRFKLNCGGPGTTVEREGETDTYRIVVPWNDDLPQGRTSILLVANNGRYDSNPAVVNVYRKKDDIPGNGMGPGDYAYSAKHANLRPVLSGITDRVVTPGQTVRIPIRALDPEGFPVRIEKRAGETGEWDGSHFVWEVPRSTPPGTYPVTVIASDGTSGDSYAGETMSLEVAPSVFAVLSADRLVGPAPLTVGVSAEGSFDRAGKIAFGWEFYAPDGKRKAAPLAEQVHDPKASHTFEKPGIYEIALTVKGPSGEDRETVTVLVTDGPSPSIPAALAVEGNDARIGPGDATPGPFDHTWFGRVAGGQTEDRLFRLVNLGDGDLDLSAPSALVVGGENPREFTVFRSPRETIEGRGSALVGIRFSPAGAGERKALVTIRPEGGREVAFAVGGIGDVDQAAIDRKAAPDFEAAKKLFEAEDWGLARRRLAAFVEKWPGATFAAEAKGLIERIDTDPQIADALKATAEAEARTAEQDKEERKAKALWNLAENFRRNGRPDLAKEKLKALASDYPDTTWGAKAKELLAR